MRYAGTVSTAPSRRLATVADLAEHEHAEIIGGEIVEKAQPGFAHSVGQSGLNVFLGARFNRRGAGGGGPGGWLILVEVTIELAPHEVYQPDLSGWRRERIVTPLSGFPVRLRPDWVCELLSPSNARNDLVRKLRGYHAAGVPHYWIADPERETLLIHRWSEQGYVVVQTAQRGETIHAEPFEAVPLPVGLLFGDDPDDLGL